MLLIRSVYIYIPVCVSNLTVTDLIAIQKTKQTLENRVTAKPVMDVVREEMDTNIHTATPSA